MTFKEFVILAYGFVMGASTPYLKPSKRFLFPSVLHEIDSDLTLFLGGSGVCAVLGHGANALVINTNQGEAASHWRECLDSRGVSAQAPLVLSAQSGEFSGGIALFPDAESVYCTGQNELVHHPHLKSLEAEKVLRIGDESVRLVPIGAAATGTDLAIYLEKRKILFLGAMYYNRIHPILRQSAGLQPERWLEQMTVLLDRFQPELVVPGEGDVANAMEAREFIAYLRSLLDPQVEFSYCRENFDWAEIPSLTSLEENFDLLRENRKTHTSLYKHN